MCEVELKTLKLKRRNLHASFKRLRNYLDTHDTTDITQLQTRQVKLQNLFEQFEDIQTQIEVQEEFETQDQEREQFEETYYNLACRIKNLLNSDNSDSNSAASTAQSSSIESLSHSGVRLPTINLPTFSGDYEQWFPFYDTFRSLIHQSEGISEIQKFQYLKTSLTGAAATTLQSLEISAENYKNAWQMLIDRYDNKRLIVHKHIQAMHELAHVSKESHDHIRPLLDGVLKHVRALTSLNRPTEHWDDLLIYLTTSKLDQATRKEWETYVSSNDFPLFKELTTFLARKCNTLETTSKTAITVTNAKGPYMKRTSSYALTKNVTCVFCSGNHKIYNCNKFLAQTVDRRIQNVKSKNLCYNCLQASHSASQCKAGSCRSCHKKHHTSLHVEKQSIASIESDNLPSNSSTSISNHSSHLHASTQILLSTALVKVFDNKGKPHIGRALLDSGSQSNLITKEFASKLSLPQNTTQISISGINQRTSQVTRSMKARLKSSHSDFETEIECLVLNNISADIPQISFSRADWRIPRNIKLADSEYNISRGIDLLIGADLFFQLLCVGRIELGKGQPLLQKTLLGWIVSGRTPFSHSASVHVNLSTIDRIERQLAQFWELENISHVSNLSYIERACEDHFMKTYQRDAVGRFVVSLPRKSNTHQLGQSHDQAIKRLYALERRLDKQPELKIEYSKFLKEYLDLGHMKKLSKNEASLMVTPHFYLPHHAVVKDSSTTTKVRVVFDGSAKSSSGISLNDTLMVGPKLQQDLFEIVSRFRTHKIVLTADVAKMYRQVRVNPKQTPLQRILWRENNTDEIQTFELTTVTYGTASASYLAIKCLQQLAVEEQAEHPIGASIALRDFYVDDLLTGANCVSEAISIKREIVNLLARGGFELRKWSSNHKALLDDVILDQGGTECIDLDKSEGVSTLGLQWVPTSDVLQYRVRLPNSSKKISKRSVLSRISQVFDPLGLIAPVIIMSKIFMQGLWELKLSWEESLPIELHASWLKYEEEFQYLNQIQIPRCVLGLGKAKTIELHGFCDASEKAYGACIYMRVRNFTDAWTCNLLCSKSRVAPLKSISLPRLELCGALLLAQLMTRIKGCLNLPFERLFYWTDSTVVLSWLKCTSRTWKTFVANRVSEIQETTHSLDWHHVKTNDNPADILSRGISPKVLQQSSLWWTGPDWLLLENCKWPQQLEVSASHDEESERRQVHTLAASTTSPIDWFLRFSDLSRLIRVIAYCQRFKNNLLARLSRCTTKIEIGPLNCENLNIATNTLVKIVQRQVFSDDIHHFREYGRISQKSKLLKLNPFLDDQGLLRVGGRLRHSSLPYNHKHPMLLPSKHPFTELVIKREHIRQLHAGVQTTIATIRTKYWILAARNSVNTVLRRCIPCFKVKPSVNQQAMGDLPAHRASPARIFENVGIDYFGPLYLKNGKRRNSPTIKAYGAIFICFVSKAVHLELVSSLSAEGFLAALKRFTSRRGKPSNVYSDNGTQFVGAQRELNKLVRLTQSQEKEDKIQGFSAQENIKWHFIPARSPHFGGLWESAVKSTKHHLIRVMGNTSLNFEEMCTLLIQIESILNSRPLTPISNDPNDLAFLTPSHFLIGDSLAAVPEPTLCNLKLNTLSRWQHIQQVRDHFWKRWSKEYLNQLQVRNRWKSSTGRQLKPNDMVLVREDNVPPLRWPIGRIEQVFPGVDGVVRVASVKTTRGSFRRATSKLCLLPIN